MVYKKESKGEKLFTMILSVTINTIMAVGFFHIASYLYTTGLYDSNHLFGIGFLSCFLGMMITSYTTFSVIWEADL